MEVNAKISPYQGRGKEVGNDAHQPPKVGELMGAALDKLAHLRKVASETEIKPLRATDQDQPIDGKGGRQKLLKRARSKYITNGITGKLRALKSPLEKSYLNTFFCCSSMQQKGQVITSTYCGNRWCLLCNRIRTARLISGYQKPLTDLPDLHFVTLTRPNVSAHLLRSEIKTMLSELREIQNGFFRKNKIQFRGIRKIECTYNIKRDDYHPHFHLIVSGREQAYLLRDLWVKRNPTANLAAQDIRKCDENSLLELFKYFTKIIQDGKLYAQPLDNIFRAIRRVRVFQPFGIRKVSEEIEELISEEYEIQMREVVWIWRDDQQSGDWYSVETGEGLTGYAPNDWAKGFRAEDLQKEL